MGLIFDENLLAVRPPTPGEGHMVWNMILKNLADEERQILLAEIAKSPLLYCMTAVATTTMYYVTEIMVTSIFTSLIIVLCCAFALFLIKMKRFELTCCPAEERLDLVGYYQRHGTGFWVATYGERVVGTVAVARITATTVELKRMTVEKDFRRLGIAQKLLKIAVEFCKQHGYQEIELSTSARNMAAIRLYMKCGFQHCETMDDFYIPGILDMKVVKLRMSLL